VLDRKVIGAAVLAIGLMVSGRCLAEGAVALGQPADIAQDGVAIFTFVNARTSTEAKDRALAGCKNMDASPKAKSLCKIAATFKNQCVAQALDPESGTPGFGWAMAPNSKAAREQALSNCRDTAGPTRQQACVVGRESLWCDGSAK
jgi:hypothetical protein